MPRQPLNRRTLWAGLAALVTLGAATVLLLGLPIATLFQNRGSLHGFLEAQGLWGPLILMALQVAQVIAAPVPGHLLAVVGGALYGPWRGTAYAALGVGLGSAIVLWLTRRLGRPLVARWVPPAALQRIDRWSARRGPLFFFLFFLLPFLPDDLACFAAGMSALPLLPMLGLIVLARLPGHFLSAWLGAHAAHVPPVGWIGILVLAGLLLGLYLWRREAIETWLLARLERRDRTEGTRGGN